MRIGRGFLVICGVGLALSACSGRETAREVDPGTAETTTSPASPPARGVALTAFSYQCAGDRTIVVKNEKKGAEVWLFLPGRTVRLPRVESASGVKYTDGRVTFWSQGDQAWVETEDGKTWGCRENRPASILEDAKLRGVSFRATGNEPGWVLEISADTTVIVANYGQDRYRFATPPPNVDRENGVTTYAAASSGNPVVIRILGRRCEDTMSEGVTETTVELTLEGRLYRGCGQPLH